MNIPNIGCVLLMTGAFAIGTVNVNADPGACPSDSKLLNDGPTAVFGDGDGTFWGLVIGGFDAATAAGAVLATDEQRLAYLEQVFGQDFATLGDARQFNLDVLSETFDVNQNGYVCAYELRGTRGQADDPYFNLTHFGVSDDRIR